MPPSKAIARIVSKPSSNNLGVVYLNTNRFIVGENINFEESNIIVKGEGYFDLPTYRSVLQFYDNGGTELVLWNPSFRDVSSWYHIVLVWDTTLEQILDFTAINL